MTEMISNAAFDFMYLMRFHFQFLAIALQKDPLADFPFRISADFFKNFIQYKRERGFVHAAVDGIYFEYIPFIDICFTSSGIAETTYTGNILSISL